MIFRTPWNAFPDVAVQTTVAKVKSHPDYDAARLGFTPDCFTARETHFLTQLPSREKMQALVIESEKVRPLLNPIGEYDQQLVKDGLSPMDARAALEAKEPALVLRATSR